MSDSPKRVKSNRLSGLTLIELIFVVFVILMLLALFMPSLRTGRGTSRRMQCGNKLKQLGLALHNYHDSHGYFPPALGGTGRGASPFHGNANRLSGLVPLLPFMEQQTLWDAIAAPSTYNDVDFPAMGPAPWIEEYTPWQSRLDAFRCASAEENDEESSHPMTNYGFCIGDVARDIHKPNDRLGMFLSPIRTTFDDITDGTSNTIAMGEVGTRSGRTAIGQYAVFQSKNILDNPNLCREQLDSRHPERYAKNTRLSKLGRGRRWADGAASSSLFNTILPPNSPSCAIDGWQAVDGIYSAGSFHSGGVYVAMFDASIDFVSESIDSGDATHPTRKLSQLQGEEPVPSPYGVWGALGTANRSDQVKAP